MTPSTIDVDAPLLIERDGSVVTLRLNRPKVGNAITLPMAEALRDAAIECDEDETVRCVVLTGAGRLFCAGGDVASFSGAGDRLPVLLKRLTAALHAAISRLARMEKPLVTIINGPTAGAGVSLAILGDIALAARSAHFTLAYSGIGLSPDGGSTWLLPRLVGLRKAQEMVLLDRRLNADEAEELGLVTRVIDDVALKSYADEVVSNLSQAATQALGKSRALLQTSFSASLEGQMEAEARAISQAARSTHAMEGVTAFLGKRPPRFM